MRKQSRKLFNNKNWRAYSLWMFNVNNLGNKKKKNKHKLYRRKDCMKKFCKSLTEHTKVGFKKKKMQPLPKKELKSHEDASMLYLRKKFQ